MTVETLTEFGRLWAEANAPDSMLARVALQGYSEVGAWPSAHVQTAIRTCNSMGAETAGVEREGIEDLCDEAFGPTDSERIRAARRATVCGRCGEPLSDYSHTTLKRCGG